MMKVALGDLLGDPPSGKEGRKDAKTEIMSRKMSSSALENGCIKHTRQCRVLSIIDDLTKETRNLSVYAGW